MVILAELKEVLVISNDHAMYWRRSSIQNESPFTPLPSHTESSGQARPEDLIESPRINVRSILTNSDNFLPLSSPESFNSTFQQARYWHGTGSR